MPASQHQGQQSKQARRTNHSNYSIMDRETLRKICKDTRGCYISPDLNDKLYLNDHNFAKIEGLEEFVNLKALWLQSNALTRINGLGHLEHLRVLHLHSNRISSLSGLELLVNLDTLNLSTNVLQNLSGVGRLRNLSNLYVSRNLLRTVSDVVELKELCNLSVLDISENKVEDVAIIEALVLLKSLCVLYLEGNPVCFKVLPFRKTLVSKISTLTCLDGLTVETLERRCCEAWAIGGREAELAERALFRQEVRDRSQRDRAALRRTLAEGRARRAMREGSQEENERRERDFGHALEKVTVQDYQEGDECTVCQQEFVSGADAFQLPCQHKYHPNCILRWLAHSSSCPMCRMHLTPGKSAENENGELFESEERDAQDESSVNSEREVAGDVREAAVRDTHHTSGLAQDDPSRGGPEFRWSEERQQGQDSRDVNESSGESSVHGNAACGGSIRDSMMVHAVRESLFDWDLAAARLSCSSVKYDAVSCRKMYAHAVERWCITSRDIEG